MDLRSYELKTDREKQWSLIEERLKRDNTRREIKAKKDHFFHHIRFHAFGYLGQFVYHFDPTFEGWQKLFDEEITDPISEGEFWTLNRLMAGNLSSYFFCIEDQDYYFKATFGNTYDPERRFPIRVGRETEHRVIVLTAEDLFQALIRPFARWLSGRESGEEGLLRFNLSYFESLLRQIDTTPFQDEVLSRREESPGFKEPYYVQHAILSVLRFGFSDGEIERVRMAQKVTEIMMDHADELNELKAMYQRVRNESQSA